MSIVIVATVCMVSNMGVCKDEKIPMSDAVTNVRACQLKAQAVLAPWAVEHPGWWITRYSCKDDSKPEIDA